MNAKLLLSALVMLVLLAMAAACTTTQDGVATPVPTTKPLSTAIPTTVGPTGTTAPSLSPQPTDVIPGPKQVEIQINKDPIYGTIQVLFRGGLGQPMVTTMTIRLTRADGVVEEKTVTKPKAMDTFSFNGTKATDRVEVWASYTDGTRYKVKDQLVPFQTRP